MVDIVAEGAFGLKHSEIMEHRESIDL